MSHNGNLRRMPSRFEHRARYSAPAATVHAALVSAVYLEDRLRAIGGRGAELVEHTEADGVVTIRICQGLDAHRLPSAVRAIHKGDLTVDREERWRTAGGSFAATGQATIAGMPGEITSHARLADVAGGSELVTTAQVRVGIPLFGGKLEGVIAEQVGKLLAAESEFTGTWLAEHP